MGKTADSWTVEGALDVTGASTLTGATTMAGLSTMNTIAAGTGAANYLANYAFFLLDADGFKISGAKIIDQNTGTYVKLYVHDLGVFAQV